MDEKATGCVFSPVVYPKSRATSDEKASTETLIRVAFVGAGGVGNKNFVAGALGCIWPACSGEVGIFLVNANSSGIASSGQQGKNR